MNGRLKLSFPHGRLFYLDLQTDNQPLLMDKASKLCICFDRRLLQKAPAGFIFFNEEHSTLD